MNNNYRIILFDGDKHDRALLSLALKSALPDASILEASSAVEVAHHISAGAVDAFIADPIARFAEIVAIAADIRKRYPACLCWLFSEEGSLPPLRDCVGRGIDGRYIKNSSGFLDLPKSLHGRLRWIAELKDRLPVEPGTIFSSIFPGATCLISDDGTLLMVSDGFERLVEQPRFGLIGQTFSQFWLDAEKREQWQVQFSRPARSWEFSGRFRTSRNDKPLMAMSLRLIATESQERRIWAATLTDLSVVDIPSPVSATLAENSGEIEQIAFTLSHDLQAPLNSITSHTELLQSNLQDESDEVREAVDEIATLTARMQDMLDGILEYSMLESAEAEREIVSLDRVLEEAIANLRSDIDESGATIEHQPLPALAVMRQQMIQVFQNLISNAIKFRGNRIPRIKINAVETGEYLRIRFEDNGIGLNKSDTEHIFEMFHRADNGKKYPGVGAGLAICQRIVRAHGGEISVESTLGRGSCFILEFRGATIRTLHSGGAANEAVG